MLRLFYFRADISIDADGSTAHTPGITATFYIT